MDTKKRHECECCDGRCVGRNRNQSSGAVYGLGFLGALIYFIGQATTFWWGVVGVFQAMVWPAYAVYYGLKALLQ